MSEQPALIAEHITAESAQTTGPSGRLIVAGAAAAAGWVLLWLPVQLASNAGWVLRFLPGAR